MCLKLSTSPFVYGITTCPTVELGLELVVVVVLVPWLLFACVWLLLFSTVCVCCSKLLVVLLLVLCRLLLLWSSQLLFKPLFCTLFDGPRGVITPSQSLPKVLKFPLEKLWVSANCFCPVGKCTNDTILSQRDYDDCPIMLHEVHSTLPYNEVAFNEKLPIMKENFSTKYTPFTYKYIALNEKPHITKQNLCIFFFITGRVECIGMYVWACHTM